MIALCDELVHIIINSFPYCHRNGQLNKMYICISHNSRTRRRISAAYGRERAKDKKKEREIEIERYTFACERNCAFVE